MPILAKVPRPTPPKITQEVIDAVLALERKHCAASTWDKFAKSLVANRFPFRVQS